MHLNIFLRMDDGLPYTREELKTCTEIEPERGPLCPCCHIRIPQFADLDATEENRVRKLIRQNQMILATSELQAASGCSERFAKIWVLHSGRPFVIGTTAPCPFCGGALVTALAKQCEHCCMDWHNPEKPYNLKDSNSQN